MSPSELVKLVFAAPLVPLSRFSIMRQFLLEALLISGSGGVLGIVGVFAAAWLVTAAFGFPVAHNPVIVVVSVLTSVLIGLIFGLYLA